MSKMFYTGIEDLYLPVSNNGLNVIQLAFWDGEFLPNDPSDGGGDPIPADSIRVPDDWQERIEIAAELLGHEDAAEDVREAGVFVEFVNAARRANSWVGLSL